MTWALTQNGAAFIDDGPSYALLFLLLGIAHSGVRLGRKVYLVAMTTAANRGTLVAVSNTLIGAAMLLGGLVGVVADLFGTEALILVLGVLSLGAALYARSVEEVSEPA